LTFKGVLCIEVLSGIPPFPQMSATDFALHLVTDDLCNQTKNFIPPTTPEPFAAVIRSCLQISPDERPEFLQIFRSLEALKPKYANA
jgi:hypothetical protein